MFKSSKENSNVRESISVSMRFTRTLRFLSTGDVDRSYECIHIQSIKVSQTDCTEIILNPKESTFIIIIDIFIYKI